MIKIHKQELLFFAFAGLIGYIIDVAITSSLSQFLGVYIARIPAFIGAVTVTWVINRQLTFKHRKSTYDNILKEYLHYAALMIGGLIVNYVVYSIAITFTGDSRYAIMFCVALGSLSGMVVNYLSSKRFIFKKEI